jgi:hypothetical protein
MEKPGTVKKVILRRPESSPPTGDAGLPRGSSDPPPPFCTYYRI